MDIREPAVAGRFYPAQPDALRGAVGQFLRTAETTPRAEEVTVVVAPHAGYPYSGPTAGHAFRRIQGLSAGRVILLGPSHYYRFPGLSVYTSGAWKTPLGTVEVDSVFAAGLAEAFGSMCPEAHQPEHALEVELPFLQETIGPDFSIVPILLGSEASALHVRLAESLAAWMEPGDLLIASTDLSHFLSETAANHVDTHSLDTLIAGDPESFREGIADQSCSMCGATAVYTALVAANQLGASKRTLWDYRTSAAATGDFARVVGYGAVTLERP